MTSAYANDDRVRWLSEYYAVVSAPDDRYDVSTWDEHDWYAENALGGTSCRAANLRSREEAEAWSARTTHGPFRSADEAIRSLIGDPR